MNIGGGEVDHGSSARSLEPIEVIIEPCQTLTRQADRPLARRRAEAEAGKITQVCGRMERSRERDDKYRVKWTQVSG